MPVHRDTTYSPYTPAQLYAMVMDVARYPEFLPWCTGARILERRADGSVLAELGIRFKQFRESYVSLVRGAPPEADPMGEGRIDVTQVRGPFSTLHNRWCFRPAGDHAPAGAAPGGTLLDFELEFHFRSRVLEAVIGLLYGHAVRKMSQAFQDRAHQLYGPSANT